MCAKLLAHTASEARKDEVIARLKAKVARLERERGKAVRDAKEEPYEENTPSSKQNFKKDTPQEMRTRQGGAKEGHGRATARAASTAGGSSRGSSRSSCSGRRAAGSCRRSCSTA